jgi:hypothetical protein
MGLMAEAQEERSGRPGPWAQSDLACAIAAFCIAICSFSRLSRRTLFWDISLGVVFAWPQRCPYREEIHEVRRKRNVRSNKPVHVFSFVAQLSTERSVVVATARVQIRLFTFFPIASHFQARRHSSISSLFFIASLTITQVLDK